MRSINESFYKSQEWRRCRQEYLTKVNHQCERCRAKGLIVPAYIVHHKERLNRNNENDPSKTLSFENLEALCKTCHNQEHFKGEEKKRWSIAEDGELVF